MNKFPDCTGVERVGGAVSSMPQPWPSLPYDSATRDEDVGQAACGQ